MLVGTYPFGKSCRVNVLLVAHLAFLRSGLLVGSGPTAVVQPRSPPATGKVTPVMSEASSEARNRIAAACSAVVPKRFIGLEEKA